MKKIINGLKTDDSKEIHPSPQKKKGKIQNAKVFHAFLFTKGILCKRAS
jgi:hypothetical protein